MQLIYVNIMREKLGADLVEHCMGHFSDSDGMSELPVVLESVLKLSE